MVFHATSSEVDVLEKLESMERRIQKLEASQGMFLFQHKSDISDIEGFKKFQQKINLLPVGFELTTAAITGLEFQLPYPLSHQAIC